MVPGGPRRSVQEAKKWAAASARNLARRLRRERADDLRSAGQVSLAHRARDLHTALQGHASFSAAGEAAGGKRGAVAQEALAQSPAAHHLDVDDLDEYEIEFYCPPAEGEEAYDVTNMSDTFFSCSSESEQDLSECESVACYDDHSDTEPEPKPSEMVASESLCGNAADASTEFPISDSGLFFMEIAKVCYESYPGPQGAVAWAGNWRNTFLSMGVSRQEADITILNSFVAHHDIRPGPLLGAVAHELSIYVSPEFASQNFGLQSLD